MTGVIYNCIKMAMSEEHRKVLRENRVALVKDMQIGEDLLSHLMGCGIITSDMKEQIDVGIIFLLSYVIKSNVLNRNMYKCLSL